ncbi:MAG: UDP-N-acetylmuramate--L-alanine ligase [Fibrobacterales bacterium]
MIPSSRIKKLHFVGIGGAGMSGIAEVLHENGFNITGSDMNTGPVIEYLKNKGMTIAIGHSVENIIDADIVVRSSAISHDNIEIAAAIEQNIPVIRRAEMLGELMRLKYTLAVAGTHGKTTTTSMVGAIWNEAKLDPTIIVGGVVKSLGTGAQYGAGDALIAEADEYDKSFLQMVPSMALITNVDEDHLDCYADMDEIKSAFIQFANKVPFYGQAIVCIDDLGIQEIIPSIVKPVVTYGFSKQADYRVDSVERDGFITHFSVVAFGENLGSIELQIPGSHNVNNAMGAIALAHEEGIPFEVIQSGIKNFSGVKRRFERVGSVNGCPIYDDYAHHPTEVAATLRAAKEHFYDKRVVVVFQPHLYSRTLDHYEAFASAFVDSDTVIVTDIYGAREKPIEGVTSQLIIGACKKLGHKDVRALSDFEEITNILKNELNGTDVVLVMGAGTVWKIGAQLGAEG